MCIRVILSVTRLASHDFGRGGHGDFESAFCICHALVDNVEGEGTAGAGSPVVVVLQQFGAVSHETAVQMAEMADTMMFFADTMACMGVSAEEFSKVYREKHEKNMNRWKR